MAQARRAALAPLTPSRPASRALKRCPRSVPLLPFDL
jgi:hypothetical protein